MNLNMGHLALVLFIGAITGLALNPFVETPLNPAKEVITTATSTTTSTTTLPPVISTSSTTITETSTRTSTETRSTTRTTTLSTTLTTTSTTTQTTTTTSTTTSRTTLTTTTTSTTRLTTTSTTTTTTTTTSRTTVTTTIIDTSTWRGWGIQIKQPPNIDLFQGESEAKYGHTSGYVEWLWDDYVLDLYIGWDIVYESPYETIFDLERSRSGIVNAKVLDNGTVTIDDLDWKYEIVSFQFEGDWWDYYMVNAVGYYENERMVYWISYTTSYQTIPFDSADLLEEMMEFGYTFKTTN